MRLTRYLDRLIPATSEDAYDLLTGYGFARRYVGGMAVADIGWEEVGYGTHLLAETAESVVGLTRSSRAVEMASAIYSAPNTSYRKVSLPALPHPEGHFDAVVALGVIQNLDHPDNLVRELKRVLKQSGVLVISTPDKQAHANDRNRGEPEHQRELYAPEFHELLERYFRHVRAYRQGAVAGGLVFEDSDGLATALVESARLSLTNPPFGKKPPVTHSIIAVCSDAEVHGREDEQPYLLLDRDRRVFDECEDLSEDAQLLRDELQRMQRTEAQAFQDTLTLRGSETEYFRTQLERFRTQLERSEARSEALRARNEQLEAQKKSLQEHFERQKKGLQEHFERQKKGLQEHFERQKKGLQEHFERQKKGLEQRLHDIESSRTWRLLGFYRDLRARLKP